MAILPSAGITADSPFCDYLNLTFPADSLDDVRRVVLPRIASSLLIPDERRAGFWRVVPASLRSGVLSPALSFDGSLVPRGALWLHRVHGVSRLSMSGAVVERFRLVGEWLPLLADLAALGGYRVTRIDVAVDLPIPAPDWLPVVKAVALSGLLLGRKALLQRDVCWHGGVDARGVETGTVDLRKRTAEVSAVVYDKRHEVESRGEADVGPLTRVELRLGAVGASLRDAAIAGPLFWHYGSALVAAPAGVVPWVPGTPGFDMPARPACEPWEVLRRRIDASADLREIGLMAYLLGPYGVSMAASHIRGVLEGIAALEGFSGGDGAGLSFSSRDGALQGLLGASGGGTAALVPDRGTAVGSLSAAGRSVTG